MDDGREARMLDGLADPAAYPWSPDAVRRIDTHVSRVFMAGDRVVKIKRPVDLGFVDHRSAAARRQACLDEDRLNKRLCDDVYLGVEPVAETAEGVRIGGAGEVMEWAVVMRRLPADRMLDVLLERAAAPADVADRLANRLVPFHAAVERCGGEPGACAEVQAGVLLDNLDALPALPPGQRDPGLVGAIGRAMREYLAAARGVLVRRCADGWVRDGHGDLRCEHVSLEAGKSPQLYDCVEFSHELRCADVASDLAYLLMDLDRLGASDVAEAVLGRYRAAGFDLPDPLIRLYRAHRALVRAKVNGIEEAQRTGDPIGLGSAAAEYLDLAAADVLRFRPMLVAMTGVSGTGKSTVAKRLARVLRMPRIRSDEVRREMATSDGAVARYDAETTRRTYARLGALGSDAVRRRGGAILDATFLDAASRHGAAEHARSLGVPFVLVETRCSAAEALARIAARAAAGSDPSEATAEVFRRQRVSVGDHPPGLPEGTIHVVIDTSGWQPAPLGALLAGLDAASLVESALAAG